jgi:hypothetical protein
MASMEQETRLQALLAKMDVPPARLTDYRWLTRNLGIRNREHPDFQEASTIIQGLAPMRAGQLWGEQ